MRADGTVVYKPKRLGGCFRRERSKADILSRQTKDGLQVKYVSNW